MVQFYTETEIIITDDHFLYRHGLFIYLKESGFENIRQASDGIELLDQLKMRAAEIVLLDIRMPKMNGMEALMQMKKMFPSVRTLVISAFEYAQNVQQCYHLGAWGFISKASHPDQILAAIEHVLENKSFYSPSVAGTLLAHHEEMQKGQITENDLEVMRLLAEGFTSAQIGKLQCLSEKTIDTQRGLLFKKMGVKNVAQLIHEAHRRHLLE